MCLCAFRSTFAFIIPCLSSEHDWSVKIVGFGTGATLIYLGRVGGKRKEGARHSGRRRQASKQRQAGGTANEYCEYFNDGRGPLLAIVSPVRGFQL